MDLAQYNPLVAQAKAVSNVFKGAVGAPPPAPEAPAQPGASPASIAPGASPAPQAGLAAGAPQGPANAPAAPQASPTDGFTDIMAKGEQMQEAGIRGQAKATSEQAKAESAIHQQQVDNTALQLAKEQEAQVKAVEANQAFVNDVKAGYIQPNHYMEGRSTPQRVQTAIGILLSGVGSGLSGQENMAMKFLNDQINRDVAAQEKNLNAKNSLLAHNLQFTKNQQDARALTRSMINEGYIHQIEQAASTAKGQSAQAAAQQAIGALKQQNAFILSGVGKTGQGGASNDPDSQIRGQLDTLRIVAPEKAKALEERYVPGVGVASIPVPAAVREQMVGQQNFMNLINKMEAFAKKNEGSLTPAKVNEGKVIAAELASAYRQATKGGTYKEGEQKFIDTIVPEDPTAFFASQRVLPKLKGLRDSAIQQQNTLNKSYGLRPMGGGGSPAASGGGPVRFTPKR
jgi:hypothetical protein